MRLVSSEPPIRRTSITLDDGWTFVPDPAGTCELGTLGEGEPIAVPGSWEEHLGGIGGVATGWYRRLVEIPEEWAGDHVIVRFGAAMERCEVWVDGVSADTHEGGYVPFEIAMPGGTCQAE